MGVFTRTKIEKPLGNAETILEKFNRLQRAIGAGVTGELAAAVQGHVAAVRALGEAETRKALGEADSGVVKAASAKVETTRVTIELVSAKLRGLRNGLGQMGGSLSAAYEELNGALPAYYENISEDFAKEWAQACEKFALALGKRRAIETMIGERLNLAEPRPAAADMGHLAVPMTRLEDVHNALAELASWRSWESSTGIFDHRPVAELSPGAVFAIDKATNGLPAGAPVVEASFEPGRLRQLAHHGLVTPYRDPATTQSLWDAKQRLNEVTEAKRQREIADEQKRRDARPDFDFRNTQIYPELSPEERRKRLEVLPEPETPGPVLGFGRQPVPEPPVNDETETENRVA